MSENGAIQYNRRKGWELAFAACANTVPTLFVILMTFTTYIGTGVYGATTVLAGTIVTGSRIFDGITDPPIALFAERLETRFGRARPLMLLGWLTIAVSVILMFVLCPGAGQVWVFILIYMLYIIGYTIYGIGMQLVPAIMTNDPKQRPIYNRWTTTYTTIVSNCLSIVLAATLMPKHNFKYGLPLFKDLTFLLIGLSGVMVALSVIAITHAKVDVPTTYVGKTKQRTSFRDMWDVLRHNRALQMYIIAGASDKLGLQTASQSAINVMVFGIVIGNYKFMSSLSMVNMIVTLIMVNFFASRLAGNKGMKRALVTWTWASMVALAAMFFFMACVDTLSITTSGVLTIVFIVLYCAMGATKMATSCVSHPCVPDIIDYEFYRSGRYVPSVIGAAYSFMDKMVSSLASTVVALVVALVGYTSTMPQATDPLTTPVFYAAMFLWLGMPFLGYLCTIIAMKFYPLTKEKMEEIQKANAETRASLKAEK